MDLTNNGKFLALILRHKPQTIGITLNEHGWADVDELIRGIQQDRPFDIAMLEEIVTTDDKQRYSFNADKTKIRAAQGHSIKVDVELKQMTPPDILWHGTGAKYVDRIDVQGLKKRTRLYVHLSKDYDTAVKVGKRHGEPVVYEVSAGQMAKDGYAFYLSENGVWLTDHVPPQYLTKFN